VILLNRSSLASAIVQRANINEKVDRLLADIPKFECDYKDMEEDNTDMEEVLTYRKRPYRCVKRPETADTENSSGPIQKNNCYFLYLLFLVFLHNDMVFSVCKNFFHIYIVKF
jgi:hypothetical protein